MDTKRKFPRKFCPIALMRWQRKTFLAGALAIFLLMINTTMVCAELTINIVAVNASDQAKEMDVKYFLPEELEPDDIKDTGPLKIDYDVDKGGYYVSGKISFQPKESKTLKVRVNDVWSIDPNEIDVLKNQLEENLKLLKSSDDVEAAKRARDKMTQQLDFILAQQQNYSQNIDRRIEEYRAYKTMLDQIRKNVYNLEFLIMESKGDEDLDDAKTVKFKIEVRNPSGTEEKKVQQKHLLPSEIRAADVVDRQNFEVRYDEKKNRSYLSREDTFAPGETKRYEIVLKDIWRFSNKKVDAMVERADVAMKEIQDTVYKDSGKFIYESIMMQVEQIKNSQEEAGSIQKHIGIFRVNGKRYEQAKLDLEHLEQMLAIVRAKKLEELESGKVKNVLQRLKALRGLQAFSEALFKKGITVTTTWRIIFGTIAFIAFFTTFHFFTWAGRSGKMGEDMAPSGDEGIKVAPKAPPPDAESEKK